MILYSGDFRLLDCWLTDFVYKFKNVICDYLHWTNDLTAALTLW
jgi:hypothetical protein